MWKLMGSDRLGDHGWDKMGFAIFDLFNFGCDCVHHVALVAMKMNNGIVSKSSINVITMRKRKKMALFQILQCRWWHCILIKCKWVYEHENVVGGICIMWNENAFDDNMVWINMLERLMREAYTRIYCRDYFIRATYPCRIHPTFLYVVGSVSTASFWYQFGMIA